MALIVAQLAPTFGYDAESRTWSLRDKTGEAFVASDKATLDAPYKRVNELFDDWKADKNTEAQYFENQKQQGPGLQQVPGGKSVIRLSYSDSQDAGKYRAARDEAEKIGVELAVDPVPGL